MRGEVVEAHMDIDSGNPDRGSLRRRIYGLLLLHWPSVTKCDTDATELRVFVAAAMNTLVTENKEPFQTDNNAKLLFNAGSSDALYAQILVGSPADVYMAGDFKWLKKLEGWRVALPRQVLESHD